jgi:hypothetical protein
LPFTRVEVLAAMSEAANTFAASARHNWAELVRLAHQIHPNGIEKSANALAASAGVGAQGIREKLQAIRWHFAAGRTEESIIELGQHDAIHEYREERNGKRLDPLVPMTFRITEELRRYVLAEITRIRKVLGHRSRPGAPCDMETFFTWLHAEMLEWTAQQIRHSAGMPRLKRHAQTNREAEGQVDHAPEKK